MASPIVIDELAGVSHGWVFDVILRAKPDVESVNTFELLVIRLVLPLFVMVRFASRAGSMLTTEVSNFKFDVKFAFQLDAPYS